MSNLNLADLKLGGRLSAIADAVLHERFTTAQAIANGLQNEFGLKSAYQAGVLEVEEWSADAPESAEAKPAPAPPPPHRGLSAEALQACVRGAHTFGPVDGRGWRTCSVCEQTNVAPA